MHVFVEGLIIGLLIAAPVGPIGLLCIRKTLAYGRIPGFISGLGAATADATYGMIAAFGLTFITSIFIEYELPIRIIGGLALLFIAFQIFFSKPPSEEKEVKKDSLIKSYLLTLFLTITNPATIISFIGIFAGLGVGVGSGDYKSALIVVLGVFLGSALWWLFLSFLVSIFREKVQGERMVWVNRISGILMAALGILSFIS